MNDLFKFFKDNNVELKPYFGCEQCKKWFDVGKELIAEKEKEKQSYRQQLQESRKLIIDLLEVAQMYSRRSNGSSVVAFERGTNKVLLDSDEVKKEAKDYLKLLKKEIKND